MNFASNVTCLTSVAYYKHGWILDTGATDHIAMDISLFKKLRSQAQTVTSHCQMLRQ